MASIHFNEGAPKPYQVRWRDAAGNQRKRSFKTNPEAKRFRSKVEVEVSADQQDGINDPNVTLAVYAAQWHRSLGGAERTRKIRELNLRKHINPYLGDRPVRQIRHSEVRAMVTQWEETLAPSTVRTTFQTIRAVLRAAARDRIIDRSPAEGIRLPEVEDSKVEVLTRGEIDTLMAALPERYRAMVTVGVGTGLRRGELLGLQWGDLEDGYLHVRRQVLTSGRVGPPKTKRSRRKIPLSEHCAQALAEHFQLCGGEQSDHIFRPDGQPFLTAQQFDGLWYRATSAAEVLKTSHVMRHTYATIQIVSGRDVKSVSTWLGHTNPAITLKTYTHLWPGSDDLGRQAIDDFFEPGTPDVPLA